MGYMHIPNLCKDDSVMLFREVWATEKIDGTSAHVAWDPEKQSITFYSGGADREKFISLFDDTFKDRFMRLVERGGRDISTVIYGEAYGGKVQGMSKTYGKDLRFAAFDVKIGCRFLSFEKVLEICNELEIESVPCTIIKCTEKELLAARNTPSAMAMRRGCSLNKDRHGFCPPHREGIVIRPLEEMSSNKGRVIAKYKNPEFSERKSKSDTEYSAERKAKILEADKAADDFVTEERLNHVLDALEIKYLTEKHTGSIIKAMVEDVIREGTGEVEDSRDLRKAISRKAVEVIRKRLGLID